MSPSAQSSLQAGVVLVELELAFEAPRERVWKALVSETGRWWPKDFLVGRDVKAFSLEPRLGGRLHEDWGDGQGVVWFTVNCIEAPRRLDLVGHLAPAFGGPALSYLSLQLEEAGKKTLLKLSDGVHGRVGPETETNLREGWQLLFGEALKDYVEGGPS
jgi:uncharacterized protein YndB with AHSA1/START domain